MDTAMDPDWEGAALTGKSVNFNKLTWTVTQVEVKSGVATASLTRQNEETDEDWVPFAYGRKRIVMSNNMYSYPLGGALCFDDKHQLFVYKRMYHDAYHYDISGVYIAPLT
jgi:hypothetical protein